jgi:hypothetical protein
MNSSMIGKIEKAHRYAREPERISITGFSAVLHGDNSDHTVTLNDGHWHCNCHTFESHVVGTCAHVMAMQQVLGKMLPEELRYATDETVAAVG